MQFRFTNARLLISSLALAPIIALGACENESEPEDTRGESSTIPDNTTVIDEYQMAMRSQIGQLNREIALLDEAAEDLTEDSRQQYSETMEAIKQQRDELELAIVELEVDAETAWERVKNDLDQAWENLTTDVDEARDEYFDEEDAEG